MVLKTKILLAGAVLFLVVGTILSWGPYSHMIPPSFHALFPLGAIFVGLFLVSRLFSKEDEVYADDQKRAAAASGQSPKDPPADRT